MTNSIIGQKPSGTLLFHLTDVLTDRIVPASTRPKFYWFNDRYHSHIYGDGPGADYMYFFVIKPGVSDAKLFTRHGKGDFSSMWSDYEAYLNARKADEEQGVKRYLEPGIVFSFSEMRPDLVCRFTDGFSVEARTLDGTKHATFSLSENGRFIDFANIPQLVQLLPELCNLVPVVKPSSQEVQECSFWPADVANQGRMWL